MIRIAITEAAYRAIRSTLPGTRLCGPCSVQDGQCLIHIEAAVLDRLRAMSKLGERYSV